MSSLTITFTHAEVDAVEMVLADAHSETADGYYRPLAEACLEAAKDAALREALGAAEDEWGVFINGVPAHTFASKEAAEQNAFGLKKINSGKIEVRKIDKPGRPGVSRLPHPAHGLDPDESDPGETKP